MKTSLLMSALCAAAIGLQSLPSHAILIEDDRISADEGVLEIISSLPAAPFSEKWFASGGLAPGIGIVWRQIMLPGDSLGPGADKAGGIPADGFEPLENGPVSVVSEPPVLLLIGAGLLGLILSTRWLSGKR